MCDSKRWQDRPRAKPCLRFPSRDRRQHFEKRADLRARQSARVLEGPDLDLRAVIDAPYDELAGRDILRGEQLPELPSIELALLMPEHALLNTRRLAHFVLDRFRAASAPQSKAIAAL